MIDNVQNMAKRRRSTPTYYHQWKKCLPSKEYLLLLPRRLSLLLCREIWRYCKCVVSPIGLGSVIGHRQYHRFCACPNTKFICLSNLLSTSNVLFLQPMYSHHNHTPPLDILVEGQQNPSPTRRAETVWYHQMMISNHVILVLSHLSLYLDSSAE